MGDSFTDLVEERQEGPAAGKPDADDACSDDDFGSDFHQAASPSTGMPFAKRIVLSPSVLISLAVSFPQSGDGQFCGWLGHRWLGDVLP